MCLRSRGPVVLGKVRADFGNAAIHKESRFEHQYHPVFCTHVPSNLESWERALPHRNSMFEFLGYCRKDAVPNQRISEPAQFPIM